MPGIEVEEGHQEVQSHGRAGGDDEIGEDVVAQLERDGGSFELRNDDVDGGEDCVCHDDREDYHAGHEYLLGARETLSVSENWGSMESKRTLVVYFPWTA